MGFGGMQYFRLIFVLLAAGQLSACATQSIPFDRQAANINSIDVLEPALPERAVMYQAATAGASFGLVGALIDASIQASRGDKFEKMATAAGYQPDTELRGLLLAELQEHEFSVELFPLERTKAGFLESYAGLGGDRDAYLDINVLGYGYTSVTYGKDWRPYIWLECRLVSRVTGKTEMQAVIYYNPPSQYIGEDAIKLAPSSTDPSYDNIDEIVADPEKSLAALRGAMETAVDALGTLLD